MNVRVLWLTIFFLVVLSYPIHGQTVPATPQESSMAGMLRACSAVADELSAARLLIDAQKAENASLAGLLDAESKRAQLALEALQLAKEKAEALLVANAAQQRELDTFRTLTETLKQDVAKAKASAKRARRLATGAGVVASVLLFILGSR